MRRTSGLESGGSKAAVAPLPPQGVLTQILTGISTAFKLNHQEELRMNKA